MAQVVSLRSSPGKPISLIVVPVLASRLREDWEEEEEDVEEEEEENEKVSNYSAIDLSIWATK